MAVADQVVVELRANTQQYLAGVSRAEATFRKSMGEIDALADSAGASLDAMGTRGAAGLNKIAAAAPRTATALRGVNTNTANLAAQFQDIGVQLAAGTSPFTILAQQLPQLTQGGGSLNGVMGALRSTVSSLISPLGLLTAGFVLLTSVAIPYFVELLSSGAKSEEQLKREAQLIQTVADKWGEALPAIKRYADERQRILENQQLREGTALTIEDLFNQANDAVEAFRQSFAAATGSILSESEGELKRAFGALQSAVKAYEEETRRGGDTTDEFQRVTALLAQIMNSDAIPATGAFRDAVDQLGAALGFAAGEAQKLNEAQRAIAAGGPIGGGTIADGKGGRLQGAVALPGSAPTPTGSPNREDAFAQRDAALARAARAGSRRGKSEAEREAEATAKLIDQLTHELSLIGMTNEQRLVANNLRRLGANATDEQRQKVIELTEAIYQQSEAEKEAKKTAEEWASIGKDALGGFIQDIRNGVSAADALNNALNRVLDSLLEMALTSLFKGGNGFLSNLFGGFRANGGPVSAGRSYIVGERGPEFFTPGRAGSIIPATPQMAGKSSGQAGNTFSFYIDAKGADPSVIPRFEAALAEVKRSIPNVSQATAKNQSSRGVRPSQ